MKIIITHYVKGQKIKNKVNSSHVILRYEEVFSRIYSFLITTIMYNVQFVPATKKQKTASIAFYIKFEIKYDL